jgi:diamine N-acetyltransferase
VSATVALREGGTADLAQLCVLATHVFVDTYCAGGLRPDQAREALAAYAVAAFERRLAAGHRFTLAVSGEHLLGFAETAGSQAAPLAVVAEALELTRLYVDPGVQGRGIGRLLLRHAESLAQADGHAGVWLTAWAGNAKARAFYLAAGYADLGRWDYVFEDQVYENRIYFKAPAAVP